jgi:RHS repeat-associated protein
MVPEQQEGCRVNGTPNPGIAAWSGDAGGQISRSSYYRARYYDPNTGRFISEDSARFSESTNFYPYVGNNPLTYIDPFGQGIVDCAEELARLAYLEGVKAGRLAEQAAATCKDKNHQKSIDQIQNAIDKQRARVIRHCSDADTKKELLLLGIIAIAIATAPETGGGSLGWAWGTVAAF